MAKNIYTEVIQSVELGRVAFLVSRPEKVKIVKEKILFGKKVVISSKIGQLNKLFSSMMLELGMHPNGVQDIECDALQEIFNDGIRIDDKKVDFIMTNNPSNQTEQSEDGHWIIYLPSPDIDVVSLKQEEINKIMETRSMLKKLKVCILCNAFAFCGL